MVEKKQDYRKSQKHGKLEENAEAEEESMWHWFCPEPHRNNGQKRRMCGGGRRGGGGGVGWGPCADPYEVDEGLGADDFHPISRVIDGHNLDDKGLAHALHAHDVVVGLHQPHPGSHHYNLLQQSLPCNAAIWEFASLHTC